MYTLECESSLPTRKNFSRPPTHNSAELTLPNRSLAAASQGPLEAPIAILPAATACRKNGRQSFDGCRRRREPADPRSCRRKVLPS